MKYSAFHIPSRLKSFRPAMEVLDQRECPAIFGNAWPSSNLTLSFVPDGTSVNGDPSQLNQLLANIPSAVQRREILRAFQTWIEPANINVGIVADGGQAIGIAGASQKDSRFGDIRLAAAPFSSDVVALGMPFDATAGTRAGDVWLNSIKAFTTTGGNAFDLYSIILHESGHVFGIPGSTDPLSVMYQEAVNPRTGLSAADKQAIINLYGTRQADSYEGNKGNETFANAIQIQPTSSQSADIIDVVADITTAADFDYYKFKAQHLQNGGLTVTLRVAGLSLLVPTLQLLDANGNPITSTIGTSPGSDDLVIHVPNPVEGATYYLRVSSGSDPQFAIGAYHIVIKPDLTSGGGSHLDDPEEGADDTPATAENVSQNITTTNSRYDYSIPSSLSTPTDIDYFRIRTPHDSGTSAGVMTATVWTSETTGMDPVLTVFDHDLVPLAFTVVSHDSGTFTIQIPNAEANRDYYFSVRHAHPGSANAIAGNYTLGVDFSQIPDTFKVFSSGTLTNQVPVSSTAITVSPFQVLHFVLEAGAGNGVTGVRLSVLAKDGTTIDTRFAAAGEYASMNLALKPGTYQILVVGGTTDGSLLPNINFTVKGLGISDPIGPKAVLPGDPPSTVPPPPPPVITTLPPQPLTPVTPASPTPPPWLILPPTSWPIPPGQALHPVARPLAHTYSVGGIDGKVRSFNPDGTERFAITVFPGFTGEVRVAEGDVNGDGVADIIAGTGPGISSQVKILDGVTLAEITTISPFEAAFKGGIFVSAGDMDVDGKVEFAVSPDESGGPRVQVYHGGDFTRTADFFGIDDPNFRGGARTAIGDVNGDGIADLIVAAGIGGGPRIATFDGSTLGPNGGPKVFGDYFMFEQSLRNGVFVTAGDVDGDGYADIIAGGGPGGGPRVYALSGRNLSINGTMVPVANFFAGDINNRGGVRVAVKDLDNDGIADLVTGSGTGAGNHVSAYLGVNLAAASPLPTYEFDAFAGVTNGVFVG